MPEEELKSLCEGIDKSVWDVGNDALYNLCQRYPDHKEDSEIIAKVWLIGRSYAAAIERRKVDEKDKKENDAFYCEDVVKCFKDAELDLDNRLQKKELHGPLARENIKEVLDVHKKLMDGIKIITKMDKRSLCSKYLHFHVPLMFPIYDSRAVQSLSVLLKRTSVKVPKISGVYDDEYERFCYGAIGLIEWVLKINGGQQITPRQFDNLLLKVSATKQPGVVIPGENVG